MSIVGLEVSQFFAFNPSTGLPLIGGKLYTYEPGTTTPKLAYQDDLGAVTHTNPIILGQLGNALVFLDGVYDLAVYDSNDVLVFTLNDVSAPLLEAQVQALIDAAIAASGIGYDVQSVSTSATLTVAAAAKLVLVDASGGDVTVTLPGAAGLQNSPAISIARSDTSANVVTIDGNGSETINGVAGIKLGIGEAVSLRSSGIGFYVMSPTQDDFVNAITPQLTTGSGAAYEIARTRPLTALRAGHGLRLVPHVPSIGDATLNVDGLGALTLKKRGDAAGTLVNIAAGDLQVTQDYAVFFDGTDLIVTVPSRAIPSMDTVAGVSDRLPPTIDAVKVYAATREWDFADIQIPVGAETEFDFLAIPAGVRELVVIGKALGAGSDRVLIQFGTSAGVEVTGYYGKSAATFGNTTPDGVLSTGFLARSITAGQPVNFTFNFVRYDDANQWSGGGIFTVDGSGAGTVQGGIDLPSELTRVRVRPELASAFVAGGRVCVGWRF